ncbi:Calcineurin subunit B type 2 [Chytridiales sp. JEL 0842]|nr:Calcineurin subunit B type 2 [Chytridiales sp. JEL 0842]
MDIGPASHIFLEAFAHAPSDVRTLVLRRILKECTRAELLHIHQQTAKSVGGFLASSAAGDADDKIQIQQQLWGRAPKSPTVFRRAPKGSSGAPVAKLTTSNSHNNDDNALIRYRRQHPHPSTHRGHRSQPNLITLPDEIHLAILLRAFGADPSCLTTFATVCKKWATLLEDNVLWKTMCETNQFTPRPHHHSSLGIPRPRGLFAGGESSSPTISSKCKGKRKARRSSSLSKRDSRGNSRSSSLSRRGNHHQEAHSGQSSGTLYLKPERERTSSVSKRHRQNSASSRQSRRHVKAGLAPWKAVYRHNHLTKLNWKRGNYTVAPLPSPQLPTGNFCMHFNDNFIVSISNQQNEFPHVWDRKTGERLMSLAGHTGVISSVKMDSRFIITGGIDSVVKVWDTQSQTCVQTLTGHTAEISALHFNDSCIVSGSEDGIIKVWSKATGELLHTLQSHTGAICTLHLDPSLPRLFSGSTDCSIKVWDLPSGTLTGTIQAHAGYVYCLQTFPSDPNILVSGGADSFIRVWDLRFANLEAEGLNAGVPNVGQRGLVGVLEGHTSAVVCIQFSETHGGHLVSGSADKTIKVWDFMSVLAPPRQQTRLEAEEEGVARGGECLYTLSSHTAAIWALAVTKDSIVTSGFDEKVLVWDFTFKEPIQDAGWVSERDNEEDDDGDEEDGFEVTPTQINKLYTRFRQLDKTRTGFITTEEMVAIPELAMNPLAHRIVSVIDSEGRNEINFRMFVEALSVFAKDAKREQKLAFAFKVYDCNADGKIDRSDLLSILRLMVGKNLPEEDIRDIVEQTIYEADVIDKDGCICFEEFKRTLFSADLGKMLTIDV